VGPSVFFFSSPSASRTCLRGSFHFTSNLEAYSDTYLGQFELSFDSEFKLREAIPKRSFSDNT
ncbi:17338_t:CDS:2, partial [Acaulospora colombiana]